MSIREFKTDMLVIGGGGAGFMAAVSAREKDVDVMLISKGPLGKSGATPMAGADYTLDGASLSRFEAFKGEPNDSPEKVFNDIITQGCFLNNQHLVDQYVQRAPHCLEKLMDWGLKIGHSDQRAIYFSGIDLMNTMLRRAKATGVELVEDVIVLELLTNEGKIAGALGLDIKSGEFLLFKCKSVIMATGGYHKTFWPNTGMRDLSGEGIAMAHRAGADIGNMEFITFCPNVFFSPQIWRGSLAPYIINLNLGGIMTNSKGQDILEGYDSLVVDKGTKTEWNKCFLSYVSAKEVREGRGFANGSIHFSRGDIPDEHLKLIPAFIFPNWKYKAIDLKDWGKMLENGEPAEVGAAAEYFEGGIVVNHRFETAIKGLYAAGECSLGPFGANRVFSAITEIIVHGLDAGYNAGEYVDNTQHVELNSDQIKQLIDDAEKPLNRKTGTNAAQLRRRVQEQAHQCLGPVRSQAELNGFIQFLEEVKTDQLPELSSTSKSRVYNKGWLDALELPNMIHVLESTAKSAVVRTESRGVHFLEEYPYTDNDNWLKESIVKFEEKGMHVAHRPISATSLHPSEGVVPYLDYIKTMMEARSDIRGKH